MERSHYDAALALWHGRSPDQRGLERAAEMDRERLLGLRASPRRQALTVIRGGLDERSD